MIAVLVVLCANAAAAPAGWTSSNDEPAAARVRATPHFGSATPDVTVTVFQPRGIGGIELVATRVTAAAPSDLAAAIRGEVDALHGASTRAGLTSASVDETSWQERADPDARLVIAEHAYRDQSSALATRARLVIGATRLQLVAVTGECIAHDGADPKLIAACAASLGSIDIGIPLGDRVAITLAPPGTPPIELPRTPQTSMTESSHAPLPPIELPRPAGQTDRRPVLVGAGIVLFAAVFWWNRRHRARLEANEEDSDDR